MASNDSAVLSWGCEYCGRPDKQEGTEVEQRARIRLRGCDGEPAGGRLSFPWAPQLRVCPWRAVSEEAMSAVGLWRAWKVFGLLPYDGELTQQPAWVSEAFALCESASADAAAAVQRAQEPTQ